MRKLLFFLVLVSGAVPAQTTVDIGRYPEIERYFHKRADESRLSCEVKALKPMLGFSFRFQAGYMVRVPMRQFLGPGHKWLMMAKVTPEAGDQIPLYLAETLVLPDVPKTNMELQVGGIFLTGEGKYAVEWAMTDETGRICRADWHTEAKLRKEERSVTMAIAPNTAQGLSFRTWAPADSAHDDARKLRITVLLHAAPLFPRMTKLRAYDRGLWLGSLVSLLDSVHPESVRLVVFNLDQQKELFRREAFAPDALGQVARAMNSIELGLVDYTVLQKPHGHVDVLTDLVNQELRAKPASDAVIFLGPTARFYDKVPESALAEHAGEKPQFFYFEYKPFWSRGANFPDSIAHAIKRVKGKTIVIHTPGEFAKAIGEVQTKTGNEAVSGRQ